MNIQIRLQHVRMLIYGRVDRRVGQLPVLQQMFNILVGATDKMGRLMIGMVPTSIWRQPSAPRTRR